MKLDFSFIKRKPVTVAAIVIGGGLLLFLAMRGGGGATQSGVSAATGPSDAQIAAGLQAQQLQYQAAAVAQQGEITLATKKMDYDAQLALAGLQVQLEDARNARETAATTKLAEFAASVQSQSIQGQTAIGLTTAQAQADLARYSGMSQLITAEAQAYAIKGQTDLAPFIANAQWDIAQAQIRADVDKTIIARDRDIAIVQTQAATQQYIAKKQSQSSIWGSALGTIGTIAGAFL